MLVDYDDELTEMMLQLAQEHSEDVHLGAVDFRLI
jgi:hypothetical protein